jgi:tetratricopeptide (TPR) repeat protein
MLSANPKGTMPLRLDEERREIEAGLMERSRLRDTFRLITKTAVRPRDFQRAMLDLNPQIVHFSGHGEAEPGLAFENEMGQTQFVTGEALAGLFSLFPDLQCVVLNACYSEAQAATIAQHIPYVIGMNAAIGDRAAIEFAVGFYDALGAGRDLEFAYKLGCSAIQLAGIPEHLTPVLLQKTSPILPISIVPPPQSSIPPPLTLSTYDPDIWVGRQDLINSLKAALQGSCRLLLINGLTGMGKTALAECLAVETIAGDRNIYYSGISFDGMKEIDFTSSMRRVLEERFRTPISIEEAHNPEALIQRFIQAITTASYWIQLDSLEVLLEEDGQGGSRFADANLLELFRQVLLAGGNSRFILTSQDIPGDLETLISRYSNRCLIQALSGLDSTEQLVLFQKILAIPELDEESIAYIQQIGQAYEGHPLVLQVIAGEMKAEPFRGNVKRYWQTFQSKRSPLQSRRLERQAFNRVRESLERLPVAAQQMLCACSVFRRPVPVGFWLAMVEDGEMSFATLRDRYLVEWDSESDTAELQVRQHNLVRRVANEKLRGDTIAWEQAERQAAQLWLTVYEPESNVPNLEKVRGYLEAFYHLCAIEDWEGASEVYTKEIKSSQQEFNWQLLIWGYYRELIRISQQLSEKINTPLKGVCLKQIGSAYGYLGDLQKAIQYYSQALTFTQEIGDRRGEGDMLGALGLCYDKLGDHQRAMNYAQQRLTIAREVGDRRGEFLGLGGLGLASNNLEQYHQAIDYFQKSLSISRKTSERWAEGHALGYMGLAYSKLGQCQQAIEYFQRSLTIACEIGDRWAEGHALGGLGATLMQLKQYPEALEKLLVSLEIFKSIRHQIAQAKTYHSLATLYYQTGRSDLAREFCQQALTLALELGIPLAQDCQTLRNKLEEESHDSNS